MSTAQGGFPLLNPYQGRGGTELWKLSHRWAPLSRPHEAGWLHLLLLYFRSKKLEIQMGEVSLDLNPWYEGSPRLGQEEWLGLR